MGVSERSVVGYQNLQVPASGTLIAVGNFDGVHLGHRCLIEHVLAQAKARSLMPIAMTFAPHPATVLSAAAPILLTTTERKIELILQVAPQLNIVVQPFDSEFSQIEAETFVDQILLQSLNARYVLVGKNFHFGRARRGTPELLRALSDQKGFVAEAFELSGDKSGTFSSSRARSELTAGNVEGVAHVLGRPHAITGIVVPGDSRGRELGFPTANLAEIEEGLPLEGVYTCIVCDATPGQPVRSLGLGVMSIGPRPTVNSGFATEVHILDFSADLYTKRLRVHIVHRLRGIERFPSVQALRAQIETDVRVALEKLGQWMRFNPPPSV
jgi:riboflavin kinase/FMN adenylyltransferase